MYMKLLLVSLSVEFAQVFIWFTSSLSLLVYKLSSFLSHYGFVQSYYSLFSIYKGAIFLVVLIYVDDLIICGSHSSTIVASKAT